MSRPVFSSPLGVASLVALLFCLTLPAVTTRFYAADEVELFAWARSVAFDHDADFENEYQHFYDSGAVHTIGFHETFLERETESGRRPNFAPIGTAILWAPFMAAGHVVARLSGAAPDGYSQPYIAAVTYGSAVYGFLALGLTVLITRRVVGSTWWPTMAVAIGTPLAFYMYVAPGFSHACSAFAVSLFLYVWLRVRDRWTPAGAMALGLTGALMAIVREQDVFFVAGPALDFCRFARETIFADDANARKAPRGKIFTAAAVGCVAFAVGYAPQLAAYQALNGHPSPTELVSRKMSWTAPHFFDVMFSPEHGLFVWTPLALLGVVGLAAMAAGRSASRHRDTAWVGALALLMVILQAYISGSVESWTVAGSFGQRRFVALTPLIALGLAAGWSAVSQRASLWRATSLGLVGIAIWWQIGLMAQFGMHTMDRQRMSPRDNARVTFLELPIEIPSIVWRYLTDRKSFIAQPVP
jgi:hypothetical protein